VVRTGRERRTLFQRSAGPPHGMTSERMANTEQKAAAWVEFLAKNPAVPFRDQLQQHLSAGHITRLCDCGCNPFELEIPPGASEAARLVAIFISSARWARTLGVFKMML